MTSLESIYSNYKLYCDKGDRSDKGLYGHYYIEKYEKHFSEKRYTAKNVNGKLLSAGFNQFGYKTLKNRLFD